MVVVVHNLNARSAVKFSVTDRLCSFMLQEKYQRQAKIWKLEWKIFFKITNLLGYKLHRTPTLVNSFELCFLLKFQHKVNFFR